MNLKSLAKKAIRNDNQTTVIEPERGWRLIDWRELWRYRDLFFFLVWRDIKIRYAQSVLGWAGPSFSRSLR